MFARVEAESSKEKANKEAYDLGVAETQATSRLKSLGYAGSTIPRFGMRPLSKLGLKFHPTCGRWSMCKTPLPLGKLPPPAPRLGMLWKRLRLLDLELFWQ